MSQRPNHLVRRGDTYYFRTAIPRRSQKFFSRLELKISLRTTDREQATLRQRWVSFLWEHLTQALGNMAVATPTRIDQIVRDYFADEVNNLIFHAEEGPKASNSKSTEFSGFPKG